MGNAYLDRQAARDNEVYHTAERITEQFMTDTLQMTLHQECGWGYDRIMRLCESWVKTQKEYRPALNPIAEVEGDVKQEHMDRVLAQIIKKKAKLVPFKMRYPELKEVSYKKRGKWK